MEITKEKEVRNCDWLSHHAFGWQVGEQGILEAIIKEIENDIPVQHRWCVEFGAGDGHTLPLTCERVLRRKDWRSLLIEGDKQKCDSLTIVAPETATVLNRFVLLEGDDTIDAHMSQSGCPASPALMVCDVDGIDYHIVANMKARPYVLCVEHMDEYFETHPRKPWVPDLRDAGKLMRGPGGFYHCSATSEAFDATIPDMGYGLVYRTRYNSIYVRDDLITKVSRPPDTEIRLNIGGGDWNHPGYINVDIRDGKDARKLDYPDGSVDAIYSSHLLEHFSMHETDLILKEWTRVLKPGGIMRIAVPDAKKLAHKILSVEEDGDYERLEMMVYGAHSDLTNMHHAMFTETRLREKMQKAGLGSVRPFVPFVRDDCSNIDISLNLEGTKRWWPKKENPVLTLVLCQPRFAFTGHEIRMCELARKLDFNIVPSIGSFWDRDMSHSTAEAISKTNPDFIIYSDYDSVFEVDDVNALLEAINNDPTMAAIGSVQVSRHNDKPLVYEESVHYESGKPSRVNFSHFGLTIIRREVFDELPQPWFWSIPGKNERGEWEWGKWNQSEADITFWRVLTTMGFKIFQHNGVCIGHIVQAIKYPRDKGRGVQLVPIEVYWAKGKPKDAVFVPDLYRQPLSSLADGGSSPPSASSTGEVK